MVIMNALPATLRTSKPIKLPKDKISWNTMQLTLTETGKQTDLTSIPVRQRVARNLLNRFQQSGTISGRELKDSSPKIKQLIQQWLMCGWITKKQRPVTTNISNNPPPPLTIEQNTAVNAISASIGQFNVWLLHGITGSGKTEVYLRLIATILEQGKQILILVPEINLTPQLEAVFQNRFPNVNLISLHSGLNDTERLQGWLQAHSGQAKIVLGTRLSVFTPFHNLGLMIVDEEHDHSFKQQDGLRYSARDLAIFRSKQIDIPIILGSATPSLESYYHALNGRYRMVKLTSRAIQNAALPLIQTIDIRTHKASNGLSQPLIHALHENLAENDKALFSLTDEDMHQYCCARRVTGTLFVRVAPVD